jgi:hypothetical protein
MIRLRKIWMARKMHVSPPFPSAARANIARVCTPRRISTGRPAPTGESLERALSLAGPALCLFIIGAAVFAAAALKVWMALHP